MKTIKFSWGKTETKFFSEKANTRYFFGKRKMYPYFYKSE